MQAAAPSPPAWRSGWTSAARSTAPHDPAVPPSCWAQEHVRDGARAQHRPLVPVTFGPIEAHTRRPPRRLAHGCQRLARMGSRRVSSVTGATTGSASATCRKAPTLHPIRTRSVRVVLLGGLLALAFGTPVLAASTAASNLDVRATVAGDALAGSVGQTTLASVVLRKPDGRIRYAAHGYPGRDRPTNMPFVGNNVFNATGLRQTASVENYNELEGAYYSFEISIQNDGNRSDRFKVKATGTATSGWKVAYFRGTTNITSAIVAGTFQTSSLPPSATYLIRARITVASGGNLTRLVTIRSVAAPTKTDAVKFSYKEGSWAADLVSGPGWRDGWIQRAGLTRSRGASASLGRSQSRPCRRERSPCVCRTRARDRSRSPRSVSGPAPER